MPGFIEAFGPAVPVVGGIAAAALQRSWALKDWHRQNAYNHPSQQIARLKEAGLPLASMFSGSGGSTSSDVRNSEVDPTLGSAQGLQTFMINRLQRKQIELLDQQIGKAEADKVISQVAANKARDEDRYYREPKIDDQGFLQEGNRRRDSLIMGTEQMQSDTKIKAAMAEVANAKSKAELAHIVETNKLLELQFRDHKAFIDWKEKFFQSMKSGEFDLQSLMVMILGRLAPQIK